MDGLLIGTHVIRRKLPALFWNSFRKIGQDVPSGCCERCNNFRMDNTRKVVMLRHSESEFNKLNLFCGWHDSPLSDKGLLDSQTIAAANLAKHSAKFDHVYTSNLHRAHQTVDIILKELGSSGVDVICDWRLNERHYGNLTGFNKREVANKFGEEQVQKWRRKYDAKPPPLQPSNPYFSMILNNPNLYNVPTDRFPFTESMKDAYERIIPAWLEIKKQVMEGKRILIVAHGTVGRCLIKHIEDISDEAISKVNLPNSVPCVYEFDCETGQLVGTMKYLADEEYVKKAIQKAAKIGD